MTARLAVEWIALALGAGLWLGIAGRIAMRLVSLEAGVAPEFSTGGSVEVALFGALLGAPIALAFLIARSRWKLPAWSGVIVGLLLFAALALVPPDPARSALVATPDSPAATAVLFGLAFASYGALLGALTRLRP